MSNDGEGCDSQETDCLYSTTPHGRARSVCFGLPSLASLAPASNHVAGDVGV